VSIIDNLTLQKKTATQHKTLHTILFRNSWPKPPKNSS